MPVLVDTSGLYALADADSEAHKAVRRYVATTHEALVVPVTVLPEVDYLVATRLGVHVELAVLKSVATGELWLEGLTPADVQRCVELIDQYADSDIGFVDASIVAIAERLRISRILTLDHRHFRMLRPKHGEAFELVP
ncbi:MAG: PIN domain-containing protein [Chloroflexi bacterium]|nr:PIN domain-containing protein [Chloroflexota bacterium]